MKLGSFPAVLVAEDEPLIRLDAASMLEDEGFPTYEANSADEALALLERHDDIGILFTDIDMPGAMNGHKLTLVAADRWPDMRIVVASGAIDLESCRFPADTVFFPKPYSTHQVTRTLRGMVGGAV